MAGRPEKNKTAYVTAGHSVNTRLGTAHEGARITEKMLSGGKNTFYKLLKSKVLDYPPDISSEIKKAGNTQISLDNLNVDGNSEDSEEGKSSDENDPGNNIGNSEDSEEGKGSDENDPVNNIGNSEDSKEGKGSDRAGKKSFGARRKNK
jgi:hypothetical protein